MMLEELDAFDRATTLAMFDMEPAKLKEMASSYDRLSRFEHMRSADEANADHDRVISQKNSRFYKHKAMIVRRVLQMRGA